MVIDTNYLYEYIAEVMANNNYIFYELYTEKYQITIIFS